MHPEQMLLDDLDALAPALAAHEVVAAAVRRPRGPRTRSPTRCRRRCAETEGWTRSAASATSTRPGARAGQRSRPGTTCWSTPRPAPTCRGRSRRWSPTRPPRAAGCCTWPATAGRRTALTARLGALGLGRPGARRRTGLGVAYRGGAPAARRDDHRAGAGRRARRSAIVERELLDRRARLAGYVEALHTVREPWGCSAYDALQALARLTADRPSPRTTVRLTAQVAESLTAERRAQAASRPGDRRRARRVHREHHDHGVVRRRPAHRRPRGQGAGAGGPAPRAPTRPRTCRRPRSPRPPGSCRPETPAQWAEQLRMLGGVRQALDVFQPIAFERSAADMIAATATTQWRAEHGIDMPGRVRRRLRRQAKDLLRPGRPVADLHGALVDVQRPARDLAGALPGGRLAAPARGPRRHRAGAPGGRRRPRRLSAGAARRRAERRRARRPAVGDLLGAPGPAARRRGGARLAARTHRAAARPAQARAR